MAKQLTLSDLDRLKRFMGIAYSSDQDGEALNALRMANKLLRSGGLDWNDVFTRMITVKESYGNYSPGPRVREYEDEGEFEPQVKSDPGDMRSQIEAAFRDLEGKTGSNKKFENFINSLREQFDRDGYLSQAQRASLFKSARVARGER